MASLAPASTAARSTCVRASRQGDRQPDADIQPGATPIAFGNWQQAYTIADRKAVTMLIDPHSAGFCSIFKFEAQIGGATTCPNAAGLLRIR
jgi:HK97 family phage major capsid protein